MDLIEEALRLHHLGRPAADVRRAVLALGRNVPGMPMFSPGGLAECLDAALAAEKGGAA